MKGKLWFILVGLLLVALVLAGCGGSSKPPRDEDDTDEPVVPNTTIPQNCGMEISSNGTYKIEFSNLGWMKVEKIIADHMNAMEGYDKYESNPYAMRVYEGVASPDPSEVSGGGIYIDSVADAESDLMVTNITWTSGTESVSENFTAGSTDEPQQRIVQWKGCEVIAKSPDTGFCWGGYVDNKSEETNPLLIDGWYEGRIQFIDGGNKPGSYIYSVFDANFDPASGNPPTPTHTAANMDKGSVEITFNTEKGGANYPQKISLLIRDKNGNWYLSVGGTAEGI